MRAAFGLTLVTACWHDVPPPAAPVQPTGVVIDAPSGRPYRPAEEHPASPYVDVAGTWRGVGYQYDTHGHWDIEMTLWKRGAIGDPIGTIVYEGGNCTAELIRQPERGDTLVMREKLVTGQGQCVDNGWIRIPRRPIANELDWRWDFAAGNEGASSTVKRD